MRRHHVHRVAGGEAEDRVRAVDAPGEAVALGGGEELVLLGVVEVRGGQPRLVLVEGGVGHLADGVRLERPQVVLQAGHQCDVSDRPGRLQRGQKVSYGAAVDRDVLRLGVARVHAVMATRSGRTSVSAADSVAGSARSVTTGGDAVRAATAAGEPVGRPAVVDQQAGHRLTDDPGRSHHQCSPRLGHLRLAVLVAVRRSTSFALQPNVCVYTKRQSLRGSQD